MIGAVDGWVRHHGVHVVTLYPPGGGGRIRFLDRRPLMRMRDVVAHVLALDPGFVPTLRGATSPITTDEGEHGAWVTLRGRRDNSTVLRHVGAVFGDQFTAIFDTLVIAPERAELLELTARKLQQELVLALGVRRRWFRYAPPVGWIAIPSGLVTRWYPPEYPRERTELVVLPAEPSGLDSDAVIAEMAHGVERFAPEDEVIETSHGLTGRRLSFARQDRTNYAAVFVAAPYVYSLCMETESTERRHVFDQVARSVAPVPTSGRTQIHHPIDVELFSHLAH